MTTQFVNNKPITNPIILPNANIQAANPANNTINGMLCASTTSAMSTSPPAPPGCGSNLNVTV